MSGIPNLFLLSIIKAFSGFRLDSCLIHFWLTLLVLIWCGKKFQKTFPDFSLIYTKTPSVSDLRGGDTQGGFRIMHPILMRALSRRSRCRSRLFSCHKKEERRSYLSLEDATKRFLAISISCYFPRVSCD